MFNISYRKSFFDILGLSGIISLSYGLYQIYEPSAFVVIGGLFVLAAIKGNETK